MPEMHTIPRAEPDRSQELRIQSGSPSWAAATEALVAFWSTHCQEVESEAETAGFKPFTPTWDSAQQLVYKLLCLMPTFKKKN